MPTRNVYDTSLLIKADYTSLSLIISFNVEGRVKVDVRVIVEPRVKGDVRVIVDGRVNVGVLVKVESVDSVIKHMNISFPLTLLNVGVRVKVESVIRPQVPS